jgi:hypothetical protein
VTLSCVALLAAAPARAEEGKAKDKKDEIRRDPEGKKGISPYMEIIAKGRRAFLDRDPSRATEIFEEAVQKHPDQMLAYLLVAQLKLEKGDLKTAIELANKARDKNGHEEWHAKMLFLRADLLERKANAKPEGKGGADLKSALVTLWEQAREAWSAYVAYLSGHTRLPDYKATAEDRKKRIEARPKREKDYGDVRARIERDAKEAADKAAKEAESRANTRE